VSGAAQTPPSLPVPIRILGVGFAAGGGNDVIARILAQNLSEGPLRPGSVWINRTARELGLTPPTCWPRRRARRVQPP